MANKSDPVHHEHPLTPFSTYFKVFGTLVVLTIITVGVAQIQLGAANTLVAMAIASIKAGIVMWWFMHMKYEGKLNRIVFLNAFIFAFIFFLLTAMDVFTRRNFLNTFGS